jgi:hypothetical protein
MSSAAAERISYSSRLQVATSYRALGRTDTFEHVPYSDF